MYCPSCYDKHSEKREGAMKTAAEENIAVGDKVYIWFNNQRQDTDYRVGPVEVQRMMEPSDTSKMQVLTSYSKGETTPIEWLEKVASFGSQVRTATLEGEYVELAMVNSENVATMLYSSGIEKSDYEEAIGQWFETGRPLVMEHELPRGEIAEVGPILSIVGDRVFTGQTAPGQIVGDKAYVEYPAYMSATA